MIANLTRDTDPDLAIKGVLWQCRGAWLVLRECTLLRQNATPLIVDGDVVIHRDRVAFLQVLP